MGLLVWHNAWVAMFSYHAGMVLVLIFSRTAIQPKRLFQSHNFRIPLVTFIIGAGGGILMYLLWPFLSVPVDIHTFLQDIGLDERTWIIFIACYILINPLLEEYYWRGYLGSDSRKIILNDFLFAGYHLVVLYGKMDNFWLVVIFLILSFTGWFWRQTDRMSRGLLPSWISHLGADITTILTIYRMTG